MQDEILNLLKDHPGLLARDIANKLFTDRKTVNSLLYGKLRAKVKQDSKYKWYIKKQEESSTNKPMDVVNNTALSKLSSYYLACMDQDEAGISTFASSFNTPDYYELDNVPSNTQELISSDQFRDLNSRVNNERNSRLVIYLGYLTNLKYIKSSRSSWEGYMVEPILLFPIEEENGKVIVDFKNPIINQKPIKTFTNAEQESLMNEIVQLEEELGMSSGEIEVELDEVGPRLKSIRQEWNWKEDVTNEQFETRIPLSELQAEGIYNRAIILVAEKSPFTKGLESELKSLSRLSNEKLDGTVLQKFLANDIPALDTNDVEKIPLLEVLPMNLEQREAIESALRNPLTIITGPPGTGKSQVVTNLLINAVWQGKKVLFASKNNKAVDVVEIRVNNLGPRPILLRVGAQAYQYKLAEYLLAMLSINISDNDRIEYREYQELHSEMMLKLNNLYEQQELVIELRNKTDNLDKKLEPLREKLSREEFAQIKDIDLVYIQNKIEKFKKAVENADKEKQGLISKLLWFKLKKEKLSNANKQLQELKNVIDDTYLHLNLSETTEDNIYECYQIIKDLENILDDGFKIYGYFESLELLMDQENLVDISMKQIKVYDKISQYSKKMWEYWLKIQPQNIDKHSRLVLNQYTALLRMVMESHDTGTTLDTATYKQYQKVFREISHLLPCWATTSLSVKGKIPLEANFYDIVVFDEASQCDIASALPLLYRAKSAVVIGDPKQLSHISSLARGQDQKLLNKYNLLEQYPHWSYAFNSLFNLSAALVEPRYIINLLDHHRSHKDIIEFSNNEFYEGRLRVATNYNNLKSYNKDEPGIRWINIQGNVIRPRQGGALNSSEADSLIAELRRLVIDNGYKGTIGVVSPFRAQVNYIIEKVHKDKELSHKLVWNEFLVDTVHKFQGDEKDIMFFSPVISNNTPPGSMSFLKNNGNLFNVAITRARAQLIVVGDSSICSQCEVDYLKNFTLYVQNLQDIDTNISTEIQASDSLKYPEVSNMHQVSEWEVFFYEKLVKEGIQVIPQYSVEKYILDFALIVGDRRLNIEVDGERYHRSYNGELCRRDQIRNQRMFELGWDVKRFWVYEIRDQTTLCIEQIKNWIDNQ